MLIDVLDGLFDLPIISPEPIQHLPVQERITRKDH